jgi:hypothetical protein
MKENRFSFIYYLIQHQMDTKTTFLFFFFTIGFFPVNAGPDNIAPLAKATAVSFKSEETGPQNVTDGLINISGRGEWISKSRMTSWGYIDYPWIQLQMRRPT